MNLISSNDSYQELFASIKQQIQQAQTKAVVQVNQTLLLLYWEIGTKILERQIEQGWGTKVVEQLSKDLKKTFPNMKGFSRRNLLFMRQFAETYPDTAIVKQLVSQISWSHNILLMQKCENNVKRLWYAQKAIEHGWSRNVMVHQIELKLYERQGKAITNFKQTLPSPQSDMMQQALKDPYILDFLNLQEDVVEKELEEAIVQHITKFLLELGV